MGRGNVMPHWRQFFSFFFSIFYNVRQRLKHVHHCRVASEENSSNAGSCGQIRPVTGPLVRDLSHCCHLNDGSTRNKVGTMRACMRACGRPAQEAAFLLCVSLISSGLAPFLVKERVEVDRCDALFLE